MRRLPLLVLLLLPALLPVAGAQVPSEACGPVAMGPPTYQVSPLAPGEEGEVVVVVENGGQRAVEVTLASAAAEGGQGWTIRKPGETATLPPAGNATFTYVVVPAEGASERVTYTFTVAGATCALAPGIPCPTPQACTAQAPQPQSAQFRMQAPRGIGIPGLEGVGFPLEYLVAGVVLVGVATAVPFLLRKKGGGFSAECPEPLKMVRPGRGTSFPIEIRNGANEPVTAQFEIGPVPEGWTAFMPLPEVQLAAKEARSLWLMVRSPPGAQQGEAADVELRLRNVVRPGAAALVRVRAEVSPDGTEVPARV